MPSIEVTRRIAAPRAAVFARFSDLRDAPNVVTAIRKLEVLTDGPIGKGTTFRETRVMFGREHTETMTITAFDPPHGYEVGAESHGCRYRSSFRFVEAGPSATDVTMRFEGTPLTFMAKVMGFLMKPLTKRILAECVKDLDDLKRACEAQPASG
jgi:hypothetical protein